MRREQPRFRANGPDQPLLQDSLRCGAQASAPGFAVRYSARALPAYRFLPGRDPHPTADPRGHSVDSAPWFEIGGCAPADWADCAPYLYGVDCFNHGFWWESHEAWEPLWRGLDSESVQGHYVQGLIQAANALLKRRMGRPSAVARLRRETRRHLEWVSVARYMGLEVVAWRAGIDHCLAQPGAGFPGIYLKA
ncbi:hypothetical protein GCM10028792_17920 [Salinisphaera aquimarina]